MRVCLIEVTRYQSDIARTCLGTVPDAERVIRHARPPRDEKADETRWAAICGALPLSR